MTLRLTFKSLEFREYTLNAVKLSGICVFILDYLILHFDSI